VSYINAVNTQYGDFIIGVEWQLFPSLKHYSQTRSKHVLGLLYGKSHKDFN